MGKPWFRMRLVINTETQNTQESLLSNDQVPTNGNIATITMGEHGQQQVFVITDPAQLEALQQLAAQQQQQQRENLPDQQLTNLGVDQSESQSDLTSQSTETMTPLDQSNEGCVPKLEPGDQIESVVLNDESSFEEKEILERETDSDIVTEDNIVTGGNTPVSRAVQVLEGSVQT